MPKKKANPKPLKVNPNEYLVSAKYQLNQLIELARTKGPDQLASVNCIVRLACSACGEVEAMYFSNSHRSFVEEIASQSDYFPATFSKSTLLSSNGGWRGDVMRENLKLLWQPLKPGRKKTNAMEALRLQMELFTRGVHYPETSTPEIDPKIRKRLLAPSARNNWKKWAIEFSDWSNHAWFVESPGLWGNDIAKARLKSRSNYEANHRTRNRAENSLWPSFSAIVREQFESNFRSSGEV
jgi:hypothetical protein